MYTWYLCVHEDETTVYAMSVIFTKATAYGNFYVTSNTCVDVLLSFDIFI